MNKRVHFVDNYLLNPQHPITISLIGVGGTGSQVLTCLARMDITLRKLGHPGLYVNVYDPDIVSEANIGRQLFSPSELGLNKAECLTTKINNFFGNDWQALPVLFQEKFNKYQYEANNIMITCTDNIKSRIDMEQYLKQFTKKQYRDHTTPLYWLDFGNAQTIGQVVIGTVAKNIVQPKSRKFETVGYLKNITEFDNYSKRKDKDSGPSCSLAEALDKQDLFINSILAQLGCNLIWKMFREAKLEHHGLYLNISTLKVNPIII